MSFFQSYNKQELEDYFYSLFSKKISAIPFNTTWTLDSSNQTKTFTDKFYVGVFTIRRLYAGTQVSTTFRSQHGHRCCHLYEQTQSIDNTCLPFDLLTIVPRSGDTIPSDEIVTIDFIGYELKFL